jgi:hypothetical protein
MNNQRVNVSWLGPFPRITKKRLSPPFPRGQVERGPEDVEEWKEDKAEVREELRSTTEEDLEERVVATVYTVCKVYK